MHFVTLISVDIPKQKEEPAQNHEIAETVEMLKEQYRNNPSDICARIRCEQYIGRLTAFARAVSDAVDIAMEPYSDETENPKSLEFLDQTDELRYEYETGTADYVRMPCGKIVERHSVSVSPAFMVSGGKVYQRHAGRLHHPKRSKKAKKMQVLMDYPHRRCYRSFEEYAKEQAAYDENHQAFGYYFNPEAFYDWFVIGGRWPDMFLVEETCEEFSLGERNLDYQLPEVPEGYKWVAAARKKDIAWTAMLNHSKALAEKTYLVLQEAFRTGEIPDDFTGAVIQEKGISRFGNMLYIAGESLEDYQRRCKLDDEYNYSHLTYSYLAEDGWRYREAAFSDLVSRQPDNDVWRSEVKAYIDRLPDDAVLVGVDCHN